MEYKIAFTLESGEFDVYETFEADNDEEANEYAEENYSEEAFPSGGGEWWVLDSKKNNINE